jgi:Protein of unknown function (DUF1573)
MKNVLIILIAALSFAACKMADKKATGGELSDEARRNALKDSSNFTTIQWLDSTYRDLGTEKEGTKVEVSYHFKNTGEHNLIISNVSAQCGCTTPDWPKIPIAPGKENVIKAVFNSEHRAGENRKEIYVIANTLPQSSMTLAFRVEITN